MNEYYGWTTDEAVLAIVEELAHTEDELLLGNRKDGGVHRVWVWPLGHYDDQECFSDTDEPIWSRVDIAYGRYLKDGCTFLIWDDENYRAGTVEDAIWLRKGVNEETHRTKARAQHREMAEKARREREARGVPPGGVDFAALRRQ